MVIHSGFVWLADSGAYRPQTITLNGGTLKITGEGGLFPGADASSRVIRVNTNAVLELDTWFKADSQSLGRLNPDAGRIIVDGGTIRMTGVTGYGRGMTIHSGGATFEATATSDWLINQLTDDNAFVYNGHPTLVFTGEGIGRFEKSISGNGSVIKRGQGKWTLARTSTYTGATIVEQGILVLRRGSLNDTSTVSIANGAILSLRHYDGDAVGALILGGAVMPPGTYSRTTHPAYFAGSGSLVVGGTNVPATSGSLTWFYGGGGDASIRQTLTNSMNYCVDQYNSYAYLHGNIRADYSSGVPTAQASYGGPITFGGSRNGRVAMHEMGHVFGVGTHGNWGANLSGGVWTGPKGARLIQQIDGPGAVINSDGTHFWPYGLNYDNEGGARNEICHVRMMEAFAQDMGIYQGISTISQISDRAIATNSSTGPISFTIGDPGVAAGSLVVHAASSNPALVPTNGLVLGGSGANRTINITPAPGMSGAALITLTVSGGRDAAIMSFAFTVGNYVWSGGTGVWDTTSSNWNNGTGVWPSFGGNNDAMFNGTGGVVTVVGTINADDITFAADGYQITGGSLNLANTPALTVSNGVTAVISSALRGNANALAKEGAGTLVLNGNNALQQGIYLNAGTLVANGDSSGSRLFEARNDTTLTATGILPDTTITGTSQLSPGPGIGTLRTADLTFGNGATLTMDLGTAVDDRVIVSGNLTAAGTLNINIAETPVNGFHTLITYSGTLSGAFTLGAVPPGYSMALDYSAPGQVRLVVSGGFDASPIIASGATWKYNASGADLGTAWRAPAFNDSGWSNSVTEIGYGDGNEATAINVSGGRPQVVYFRKAFTLTAADIAAMTGLILSLLRDDGAVVFLNGTEVRRDNFPPPPAVIAYNTPASSGVTGTDESTFIPSALSPGLFVAGTNVLAVEVHQDGPTSSDISFDLKLDAVGTSGSATRYVPVSLVATGAVWKYFAQTNDLGTAWRSNSFDDSAWLSGPSMLGFGDANGLTPQTLIASNGQWTTYFRRAFFIPNVRQVQVLNARIMRDDAAVVFVNGTEAWRDPNLPGSGAIQYNTPATSSLGGADESTWLHVPLNPALLQMGTNILAIEVHQNSTTSSDLAMNFEMGAILQLPTDARIAINSTTLSWPESAGWFSVSTATNLTPPVTWTPDTNTPMLLGDEWRVTVPAATNGQRFFRLQAP